MWLPEEVVGQELAGQQTYARSQPQGLTHVSAFAGKEVRAIAFGLRHGVIAVAAHWFADDEAPCCMKCLVAFSMLNRRHHCRSCGGVFCAKCSGKKAPLLHLGFIVPARVCDDCFSRVNIFG